MVLKELIFTLDTLGVVVLKNSFFTISPLEGCGVLEGTHF